jgi:hydroxyacylglutathione hydrolase
MTVHCLTVGPVEANCYIVDCGGGRALVIDPGEEGERILRKVRELDLVVDAIVDTHGHFDHLGANAALVDGTGAPLMIHPSDLFYLRSAGADAAYYGLSLEPSPEPDILLDDGDIIDAGDITFTVIHTPGHSPGGICLLCDGCIFTGDTLFADSIGRTDLPGGNTEILLDSIRRKLLPLDEELTVYPGHGPETSIGREKVFNPFL